MLTKLVCDYLNMFFLQDYSFSSFLSSLHMLDDYLQYSNHHTSSPEVNIIVFILHVLM